MPVTYEPLSLRSSLRVGLGSGNLMIVLNRDRIRLTKVCDPTRAHDNFF